MTAFYSCGRDKANDTKPMNNPTLGELRAAGGTHHSTSGPAPPLPLVTDRLWRGPDCTHHQQIHSLLNNKITNVPKTGVLEYPDLLLISPGTLLQLRHMDRQFVLDGQSHIFSFKILAPQHLLSLNNSSWKDSCPDAVLPAGIPTSWTKFVTSIGKVSMSKGWLLC